MLGGSFSSTGTRKWVTVGGKMVRANTRAYSKPYSMIKEIAVFIICKKEKRCKKSIIFLLLCNAELIKYIRVCGCSVIKQKV